MDTVRQNEERAIESADTLPSAETLLRRLTGSLAHTLNNRLTGVIGSLDLALQGTDDPSLSVHLHRGLACALQAAELVRRMVAFAFRPSVPAYVTVRALCQIAENTAPRARAALARPECRHGQHVRWPGPRQCSPDADSSRPAC